jgi:hypothetical protein
VSVCSVGNWKHSDFPLAVPVVTIVGCSNALYSASAWWEYSASMPALSRAFVVSGFSSSGVGTV